MSILSLLKVILNTIDRSQMAPRIKVSRSVKTLPNLPLGIHLNLHDSAQIPSSRIVIDIILNSLNYDH